MDLLVQKNVRQAVVQKQFGQNDWRDCWNEGIHITLGLWTSWILDITGREVVHSLGKAEGGEGYDAIIFHVSLTKVNPLVTSFNPLILTKSIPNAEGQNSLHARMQLLATPIGKGGVAGTSTPKTARERTRKRARGTGEDPASVGNSTVELPSCFQVSLRSKGASFLDILLYYICALHLMSSIGCVQIASSAAHCTILS